MGYWEDNYGDDVDFVNPDDANWQRDPQPQEGSSPIKRVERPESEWDTVKWGKSMFEVGVSSRLNIFTRASIWILVSKSIVNKTGAKSQFLVSSAIFFFGEEALTRVVK